MLNKLLIYLFSLIFFPPLSFSQEQQAPDAEKDSIPKLSFSTVQDFSAEMDDIFDDPNFSNATWGVLIQSLETGEYFYKRNEDKLFRPASNMKLFTTAAGLNLLGSEYKFTTTVFMNGTIDGSILRGNLIIQGGGDPTISGRFYYGNIYRVFNDWVDSLLTIGIDEIDGNIIGDDNLFDDVGLGKGWSWDYESYWFSAPSGALSFNDNCVDIIVTVDTLTLQPKINVLPDTKYITLVTDISVVSKDTATSIDVYRERGTNIINVFGTIRRGGDSVKTYSTINNPTQFSMVVLKEVLERRGIKVSGYAIDIDDVEDPIDYSTMEQLFEYFSPPLRDIIKAINKNSQNFFAEQLLKTIGLETEGYGTVENGVKAISNVLKEMGINPESIVMADGSGLSQLNLVSPRHIINLLSFMYKSKYYIPFYNSLPIAGVDGTLGKRMKDTRAENQVRAKTGFLTYGRSLSGYAYTGDGEPVVFSIISNNFTVPVKLAENVQDLVCLRLVNFRRK